MFASVAHFIDRSVIRLLTRRVRRAKLRHPGLAEARLAEAVRFLNGPDFIPVASEPARVEFDSGGSGKHFRFASPRPGDVVENNTVYGRLYRCRERWQERPAVVLLPGGADFHNHRFGFPWLARQCNRAGLNAVTLELPYQFRRRPRDRKSFAKVDYVRLSQITVQGVAEIRSVVGWLGAEGCPSVALWGVSLGAWLGGLVARCDGRVNAAVMIAAPNNLLARLEKIVWGENEEARIASETLNGTPLRLAWTQPVVPKENILLVQGDYDLFVTTGPAEICEGWGGPELWRLRHGHIGVGSSMVPGLNGRILRWLGTKVVRS